MVGDYEGLIVAVYQQAIEDYLSATEELPLLKAEAEKMLKKDEKILSMSQIEYSEYKFRHKLKNDYNKLRTRYRRYCRWIKEDEQTIRECEALFKGDCLVSLMDFDVETIINELRRKRNGIKTNK